MIKQVKLILVWAFVLFPLFAFSQIDTAFVAYLANYKMKTEHAHYLENSSVSAEQKSFEKARFHVLYEEDSMFFVELNLAESLVFADNEFVSYLTVYFLKKPEAYRSLWFQKLMEHMALQSAWFASHHLTTYPTRDSEMTVPEEIRSSYHRYLKSTQKNPFLAATFSGILPGIGQLYIGKPRLFATTFLSIGVLGLQSFESYRKLGIKHPLTLVNLGFFSGFYLANIYGSYRDTKAKAKELREEYLRDASDYYQYTLRPTLY